MSRPIGRAILLACETIASRGVSTTAELQPAMGMPSSNIGKCLNRAVQLGLLTVDRDTKPITFSTLPGWRERALLVGRAKTEYDKRLERITQPPVKQHHLQTIWRSL